MLSKFLILSALTLELAYAAPKCRSGHTKGPVATGGEPIKTTAPAALSSTSTLQTSTTTTAPSTTITTAPELTCSSGSTVKLTTDCTYQSITYTICYSPPPPIQCGTGYFPGVYHPGHCIEQSTCYPVDAPYITTTCPPGGGMTAYTTNTLYQGTLADGKSTIISQVQCACASDLYYSYNPDQSTNYCMPKTNCPNNMTTSFSTNTYCLTETEPSYCSTESLSRPFCACTAGTPVYPSGGATPTGCA